MFAFLQTNVVEALVARGQRREGEIEAEYVLMKLFG